MKTLKSILLFAGLVMMANACIPEVDQIQLPTNLSENLLTASIASEPITKTTLSSEQDGVSKVLWATNDAIGVFIDGNPNANVFTLTKGAGSKNAVFKGYGSGSSYVAVYPVAAASSVDGETVSIILPEEQVYESGSFGSGAYPMVASSNSSELTFLNLCSVLKISMTGHHNVTRLVFRSNNPDIKVSGPATVSLSNPSDPVLTMSNNGCDSLVVDTGGLMLDDDKPTAIYLALPAQTYKDGFTVRVETSTGYMVKKLESDFTMVRSRKHDAATFAVKLDSGTEPSASLAGSGTEEDPFRITSVGDILLMQSAVNAGGNIRGKSGVSTSAAKAYYLLTDDLDLSPICGAASGKSWTPIADCIDSQGYNGSTSFSGVFDGGGHTITNLYINEELPYRGLFGNLDYYGTIRNLTVRGSLSGVSYYSGIIVGLGYGTLENCTSEGSINGVSDLAGLAGRGERILYCTNRATVSSRSYASGISNYLNYANGCINEGAVTSEQGSCAGGITANFNWGTIINCQNRGEVTGSYYVGGICGYSRQSTRVLNCVNSGKVAGRINGYSETRIGGIIGFVSSAYAEATSLTTMSNCLNIGEVKLEGSAEGGIAGGLAGYSGYDDNFQGDGMQSDYTMISNCYWLYDSEAGKGIETGIGRNTGREENNASLSESCMRGTAYDGVLYTANDGSAYNVLIDALNACAFDLKKTAREVISAWEYDADGYPAPSDLEAVKPGTEQPLFSLSGSEFSFMVSGGEFSVEVTSSTDYQISGIPGWISAGEVETQPNRPHTHRHHFTVTANASGAERQAEIVFTNSEGATKQVKVFQKAPYLNVSSSVLTVSNKGGSKSIQVLSSIGWKASTDVDWISISPKSGEGDGYVSVKVSENTNPKAREGTVTVEAADGSASYKVGVVQSGYTGEESAEWMELPFYHQSVAMRFTATWCGWCPYMNSSVKRAQELWPGKIQHLALHEAESDLAFGGTEALARLYKISGYPTGIVDGRITINNSTDTDAVGAQFVTAAKETEDTYGTSSGLAIRSSAAGRQVSIDVETYFKTGGDYKLVVLLVEDGIIHAQSGGSEDYRHDCVARVAATSITGDAINADDMSKQAFSYTVTAPAGCNMNNMRVFAYVYKRFGSAQKIQSEDFGDFYIDNCATTPVGEYLQLALVGGSGGGGGGDTDPGGQGNEGITSGGEIR